MASLMVIEPTWALWNLDYDDHGKYPEIIELLDKKNSILPFP